MCHVLLMLSTRELPLVELTESIWLGVEVLPPSYEPLLRRVPAMPFAYYLSSHEGCGCGFHSDEAQAENAEYNQQSLRALASYLRAQLEQPGTEIALYDTWEGSTTEGPRDNIHVTTAEIARAADPIPEDTYAVVTH
jgi:hypothetical protein